MRKNQPHHREGLSASVMGNQSMAQEKKKSPKAGRGQSN
jgi:hypothetical protein